MRALLLAALLLAAPAAANGVHPDAKPTAPTTLAPGGATHTPPQSLAAGDRLAYTWNVTQPANASLRFAVHLHEGGREVAMEERNGTSGQGAFTPSRGGQYALLWQNDGAENVTFLYTWNVERAPAPTPLPWALALAALAAGAALRRKA